MAATLETAAKNTIVDGFATAYTWFAAHTAAPSSGSNQTGSRGQTTWGAASGGARVGSAVDISIGAGVTVSHVSCQSASTSGTQAAFEDIADHVFAASGVLRITPTVTQA
jgi:hypothetical protein